MSNIKRIRIRLRAYDHRLLDQATKHIVSTAIRTGAKVVGPVPLPNEKKVFTVNRGPHIDKKSREQFEMRTHSRLAEICDYQPQTIEALMKLDLPAGVEAEVEI